MQIPVLLGGGGEGGWRRVVVKGQNPIDFYHFPQLIVYEQ